VIEIQDILLCIVAGLSAGIINTLAGSGSIITLSLLSFLGLPPNIANGTNRIGLLFQSSASSFKFYKQGELSFRNRSVLLIFTVSGAVVGVFTASRLSDSNFENILGGIFVLLFFVVLLKPQKYLVNASFLEKCLPLIFGVIGFYAGFIQAGAGVFMLAIMHSVWGKPLTELNPLKVFIILLINIVALIGYAWAGQIDWQFGFALAGGQLLGGLIGVRLNNFKKRIEPVVKIVLLLLILISIVKFWKLG
jgi:hypothetical protein